MLRTQTPFNPYTKYRDKPAPRIHWKDLLSYDERQHLDYTGITTLKAFIISWEHLKQHHIPCYYCHKIAKKLKLA
jgi:hypothetical protein